jgi:hypothetical protein
LAISSSRSRKRAPTDDAARIQRADLLVEELVLIGEGGGEAAGIIRRQIRHQLGEQAQADEKAVQRVFVQFAAAVEDVVEQNLVLREVALHQRLGERALVLEVIEEAAAELDTAPDLDIGNPVELGHDYRKLRALLPQLTVLGGCCGTDHRHVEQICASCVDKVAA